MLTFNFLPFPVLTTSRLALRPVLKTDLNEVFRLRSHPEVMKYIAKKPVETLDEVAAFIDRIATIEKDNLCVTWAITIKGDTKLIGNICLWNLQPENYRAEIGYTLLPEFHRKGIMSEAVDAAIKYAFNTLHLHSIEGHVNPKNEGSVKILERNNFTKEGHFKENQFYNGKFYDTAVYTLFENNYNRTEF